MSKRTKIIFALIGGIIVVSTITALLIWSNNQDENQTENSTASSAQEQSDNTDTNNTTPVAGNEATPTEPTSSPTTTTPKPTESPTTTPEPQLKYIQMKYEGIKEELSAISGKYHSFVQCDNNTSSCTHYVIRESSAESFPIIKMAALNMPFRLRGETKSLGVAAGHQYYQLTKKIDIQVLLAYDGVRSNFGDGTDYHSFKWCDNTRSQCFYLLLAKSKVDNKSFIASLTKDQYVAISGSVVAGGVATGSTFFRLESGYSMEKVSLVLSY